MQPLQFVGLTCDSANETKTFAVKCDVIMIDAGALFQTAYPSHYNIFRAALVVSVDTGGFRVVGVHVGTLNPPTKNSRMGESATAQSVEDNRCSSAQSLWTVGVICEIARVPDILRALQLELYSNKIPCEMRAIVPGA